MMSKTCRRINKGKSFVLCTMRFVNATVDERVLQDPASNFLSSIVLSALPCAQDS